MKQKQIAGKQINKESLHKRKEIAKIDIDENQITLEMINAKLLEVEEQWDDII